MAFFDKSVKGSPLRSRIAAFFFYSRKTRKSQKLAQYWWRAQNQGHWVFGVGCWRSFRAFHGQKFPQAPFASSNKEQPCHPAAIDGGPLICSFRGP
jgi:hypothetical protein